jgi:hypothetical protein
MGVYGPIDFRCTACGGLVEGQTKADVENLFGLRADALPENVAEDIKDDIVHCEKCNKEFKIEVRKKPGWEARIVPTDEDWGNE